MNVLINKGGAAVFFAPECDCLQVSATGNILKHEPTRRQLQDVFSYFEFVLNGWMDAVIRLVSRFLSL